MATDGRTTQQQAFDIAAGTIPWTVLERRNVRVGSGKQETMHTIIGGQESSPPLVCLAGYGAGAGFYFRNIDSLSRHFRVHLVDFLGTGMSGRPKFNAKSREEAERFFIDALAKWRQEMGIDRMILMGHSLGGYLAASYALQNPDHVEHLIMVCPAGMTQPPDETQIPKWAENFWSLRGQLYRWRRTIWNSGMFTPGSLVRLVGPWGPKLIGGYANNRFREGMGLSEEEVSAFGNYMYHISAARGSGEFALPHLLGPIAWARLPLDGRLHELKVPASLIYGEHDWMKPEAGRKVFKDMYLERGKLSSADLQFDVIPQAGHYPFLDQPEIFLHRVLKQTRSYLAKGGSAEAKRVQREMREIADMEADRSRISIDEEGRQYDL